MLVAGPLELPADFNRARVQVDILPAQANGFGLPDAYGARHRPPGAVAPLGGGSQDAASLFPGQRLDVDILTGRRVDQGADVLADLAPLPGDLQRAAQNPVDLQDGVRLEVLALEPGVKGIEVLRLETVEPVLAQLGDDPAPDLRFIRAVEGVLRDRARCDRGQPGQEPVRDGRWLTGLARGACVTFAFQLTDLAGDGCLSLGYAVATVSRAVVPDTHRDPSVPFPVNLAVVDRRPEVRFRTAHLTSSDIDRRNVH